MEHGLELGLSGCSTWTYLHCGVWDLPGPEIKPMSAAPQVDS